MEPKIQDGDLVLIRQQPSYDESDFVFVVHNQLPKLKKIIKQDNKLMLESINRFFVFFTYKKNNISHRNVHDNDVPL